MAGKITSQPQTVPIIHYGQKTEMRLVDLVTFLSKKISESMGPQISLDKLKDLDRRKDAKFTAQMVHDLVERYPLTLEPIHLTPFEQGYSRSTGDDSLPIKVRILSVVGVAGQGTVYKCEILFNNSVRFVALKVPFQNERALCFLRREQMVIKRAEKIPSVLKDTSLYSLRGVPCLVTPLCKMDLFTFSEKYNPPPFLVLEKIAYRVLEATKGLIKNDIFHLDNSLENILINCDENSFSNLEVYLADFGGAIIAPPLDAPRNVQNFINLHSISVGDTTILEYTYHRKFSDFSTLHKINTILKKLVGNSNDRLSNYSELKEELKKGMIFNLGATLYAIFSEYDLVKDGKTPPENEVKQQLALPDGHSLQKIILDAIYRLELPAQSSAHLHSS